MSVTSADVIVTVENHSGKAVVVGMREGRDEAGFQKIAYKLLFFTI